MSKKIFLIVLAASLFFFSCERKEAAKDSIETEAVKDDFTQVTDNTSFGIVLRVDASLYDLENNTGSETDRTKWIASMSLGEKIIAGDIKRVTFSGDGRVYDFIEVWRDNGARGLAWDIQIAKGGEIAVVTDEKANLYRSPRMVEVTGFLVPRKTIVGYFPETENDGFIEIKCYDPQTGAYRQNYMRISSLSFRDADIQSSILLQTAEPLKDTGTEKIRKDALLETALANYSDSVFYADIEALLFPVSQPVINTETVDLESLELESVDAESIITAEE